MQVAIASGKGGTGKTTVATNLAYVASRVGHRVAYLDCDVEEPNGHIFLKPVITDRQPVGSLVPQVDVEKCTLCGACVDACEFGAIELETDTKTACDLSAYADVWVFAEQSDGEIMKLPKGAYGPEVATDFLIDFIETNKDRPFLVYYPMILVHNPFPPTPDSADRNETDGKKNFVDMVNYMDISYR